MIVGITGGNGFIGGYVAETLLNEGHAVLIFDRRTTVEYKNPNMHHFLGDVISSVDVTEFAAHVDGIIHLAAVLGTQETIQNPVPSAHINITGALNVFEAANQYDLPVVYAGVGNHFMRNTGGGSYTISKSAAEDYSKMYNKYRGGRITTVRPVNAYGPRQSVAVPYGSSKVRKIMPSFICRGLLGHPIELYGGGVQTSDCVWVGDVAKAFVSALHYTANYGATEKPVEVGPKESHTVLEIANKVADITYNISKLPRSNIVSLPMRPGETPNSVVTSDISTLQQIGMSAEHFKSLDDGIKETAEWFNENWLPEYRSNL